MSWSRIAATQRYVSEELGTVLKDWGGKLPIALVFPNTYFLGMSSLAVHTLHRLWNAMDDIVCERVFSDWTPPLSLESGAPLDYFPVVALTISHEMDYFNVVTLLRHAGLPLLAAKRDNADPILIAGGPAVSANPEPLAPILDACVIGEIEPIIIPLTNALRQISSSRLAAMDALAEVPGVYLPHMGSHIGELDPSSLSAPPQRVTRQWLRDLDSVPTYSCILTPHTEFSNMGLLEIARGCGRGCRFCLAGYTYRPPRQRSVDMILEQAGHLLRHTQRLGLVSAAVSDYAGIDELAMRLRRMGAEISVSSMRVDPVSEPLIRALAESGSQTLTIAPEAGSERLRNVVNKTQSEENILHAAELARHHGLKQLKLYFMLGLPTEGQDDVQALVDAVKACSQHFPRNIVANITPFVPKAHTPFQRAVQTPAKVIQRRIDYVKAHLKPLGIDVRSESPAWAEIQGTLARGDRRVADALMTVQKLTPATWKQALAQIGMSAAELLRERSAEEPLPWAYVDTGVKPSYLDREAQLGWSGQPSPACGPFGCATCRRCGVEAESPPFG